MLDKTARLEKVARRHPRTPLFARLADAYLSHGKSRRARELCEEGCRRFPRYPTGFFVLSRCYEGEGRLEEARAALDMGLRLDPHCPAAFRR
ncbi:MAG: tetratricopeptide repeat protein, partial [Gemmatimonadota bacterium]